MSAHSTSDIRRSSALPSVWLVALEPFLGVGVAVDDGHRSTRKRLGERSEQRGRDRQWASRSARWFGLA